jgi:hypothetical protein
MTARTSGELPRIPGVRSDWLVSAAGGDAARRSPTPRPHPEKFLARLQHIAAVAPSWIGRSD